MVMQNELFLHQLPDFNELVAAVSKIQEIDPFFVEKDYWIMHFLYSLQQAGYVYQLKGGTSLSKGYGLIDRFSEDIDIHIDPPKKFPLNSIDSRKNYLERLTSEIESKIQGVQAQRDIAFDDKRKGFFQHGGIRLNYGSSFQIDESVTKKGVLLEVSFDDIAPVIPINISSWAYDHAISMGVEIIDNRARDVNCFEPGYTLAEKLQAIASKFRMYKTKNKFTANFMRHYYDVYRLLQEEHILAFTKTKAFEMHRIKKANKADREISLSENPAYLLHNQEDFDFLKEKYIERKALYFRGQPDFEKVIYIIREWVKAYGEKESPLPTPNQEPKPKQTPVRIKIATWNINGIAARLEVVKSWLQEASPDVVCLQEIKTVDEKFPCQQFEDLGYNVETHGQKSFNGVAILSKRPIEDVSRGLPGDDSDEQARYIEALVPTESGGTPIRIASIYLPNGNPTDSEKYPYKLKWMERLFAHAKDRLTLEEPLVLAGDYNVIPEPEDAAKPEEWTEDALFLPASRNAYRKLLYLGFSDAYRCCDANAGKYSFWDFQAGAWNKNNGIRIDHLLLSPHASDMLMESDIDKHVRSWERPSDHVPVWISLKH